MCPLCMATTAWVVAGAGSVGGLGVAWGRSRKLGRARSRSRAGIALREAEISERNRATEAERSERCAEVPGG
jgi:hypothetical protein